MAFQPAFEVSTPGGSGTRVTWAGAASKTRTIKSSEGYIYSYILYTAAKIILRKLLTHINFFNDQMEHIFT